MKVFFAGVVLLLGAAATAALDPSKSIDQYVHTQWTTEDGLPQNTVRDIIQTRDGYLWIATLGGLARFDGVRFTVFDVATTPGLGSNGVRALYEDHAGTLWIGFWDGRVSRMQAGVFSLFEHEEELAGGDVWDFLEDDEGALWIAASEDIVRWRPGTKKPLDIFRYPKLPIARSLGRDARGRVLVGGDHAFLRWADSSFTVFELDERRSFYWLHTFLDDGQGGIWLGSAGGLARLRDDSIEIVFRPPTTSTLVGGGLLRDRDGNLWLSVGRSLYRFRSAAPQSSPGELLDPQPAVFTADSRIVSLYEDREGNLWFGTFLSGLHRLHEGIFTSYGAAQGFTDSGALPITETADGEIWLGTVCDGFFRFHQGQFTRVPGPGWLDCGRALLADRDGAIWLGASGSGGSLGAGGLARLESDRITWSSEDRFRGVYALHQDRHGVVWAGLRTGGLVAIEGGELTSYTTLDGLVDDDVSFITEDRVGGLWVGTRHGMSRFYVGRFTNYTTADGLPHGYVRSIHEDSEGILWIGTYGGGLARLADGNFTVYSTRTGLPENFVSRILPDGDGNFWLSGNRGITNVRRQILEDYAHGRRESIVATLYGLADGMAISETYGGGQPAGLTANDGRLWFPTLRGVAVLDPSRLRPSAPPPLHIERVLVDHQEMGDGQEIVAPPGSTSLEVHYTALQFALAREVRFRYRLLGLDDWIEVGARRVAYYSPVPPGEYRFEVAAAAYAGGEWSAPQSFQITFEPHFWQTTWFHTLLILALVAGAYQIRNRRIRVRNRALQAEIASRQQLEEEREQVLQEMDANRVLKARIQALDQLAADEEDGGLARLARSLARQDRLYAKLLRAESPAHLAALRDELREIEADAQEAVTAASLLQPSFLTDLHRMLEGLESLERLPTGEDQALVLSQTLTRASALQEQIEAQSAGQPPLGGMALDSVRQIVADALRDLQQRAELQLRLRSKKVTVRRDAVVVLEIENAGQGTARNLTVQLTADETALDVRRARQDLKSLRRGQSARLEFLVEPKKSDRIRLAFHVVYDDPERQGKELDFADVMELRRFREPDVFRPLQPNPYVVGRPLLESDLFFGRKELFARLTTSLQGAAQDNVVVLIGQRRMGKTSILRRLHRHLPASYVLVLVDLQGFLGNGEAAFFAELVGQIVDGLEESGVSVREPPAAAFAKDPGSFFRRRFLPDVRGALEGRRLLVLFDEMEVIEERIRAGELTPKILPYLRSLMQHEEDVSFLLAGTHRLDELTADYWGVLFNLAVYLEVGHLSESDVEALFVEPMRGSFEIDSLALENIYRATGGHPHFSQLLARELVEACNRKKISYVTVQDVRKVVEVVADKGQLHISYLWDEASRDERLLLLAVKDLLAREGVASLAAARRSLVERGVETGDLADASRRLRRKEILVEEAGQLSFGIDLLRRWLDRHQELESFVVPGRSDP